MIAALALATPNARLLVLDTLLPGQCLRCEAPPQILRELIASEALPLVACGRKLRILDAEQDFPLEASDQGSAQRLRIGKSDCLELCDQALRIVQLPTIRDLAHPDRRAESMWMTGLVVHEDRTISAIHHDSLDVVGVTVEQIDLLSLDYQPRAADDPRSPFAIPRYGRSAGIVGDVFHDRQEPIRIERARVRTIQPDVVIGGGMRAAPRA